MHTHKIKVKNNSRIAETLSGEKRRKGSEGPAGKGGCHPAHLSDPSRICESSCQKPSDYTYVHMHACMYIYKISSEASEVI